MQNPVQSGKPRSMKIVGTDFDRAHRKRCNPLSLYMHDCIFVLQLAFDEQDFSGADEHPPLLVEIGVDDDVRDACQRLPLKER